MGKRGNGEGSIYYDKSKDRWYATANDAVTGKRKKVSASTRIEVGKKLTKLLGTIQQNLPIPDGRQTVKAFLIDWLVTVARPRVRPSTYVSYKALIEQHAIPELGKKRLDELQPQDCQRLFNKKLAEGLSPRRVQYLRAVLRNAINQALRWNLVARNVVALTDQPKQVQFEIRPWSPDQARAFLAHTTGDRLAALFVTALGTGARQGELLALRWEDLDFEAKTIAVRGTLQRKDKEWIVTPPKTDRSRRLLPMSAVIRDALKSHRIRQLEERLAAGELWMDNSHVFTTALGAPLHGSTVTHRFQDLVEDADLPRQRFHDLRHAAATFMLEAGVPARVVMEQLGHSQISLTLNRYSHVRATLQEEAAERLGALLVSAG